MRVVSTNFVYHRTCAKENFTLSLYILGSAETHPPPAPRRAPPRGRAAPPPRRAALWPLRRPGWRRRLALGPSRAPRPSAHRTSPLRLTPLDCVDRTAAGRRRGADPTELRPQRGAGPTCLAHTALTTHTRPRAAHGPHAGRPNLPTVRLLSHASALHRKDCGPATALTAPQHLQERIQIFGRRAAILDRSPSQYDRHAPTHHARCFWHHACAPCRGTRLAIQSIAWGHTGLVARPQRIVVMCERSAPSAPAVRDQRRTPLVRVVSKAPARHASITRTQRSQECVAEASKCHSLSDGPSAACPAQLVRLRESASGSSSASKIREKRHPHQLAPSI